MIDATDASAYRIVLATDNAPDRETLQAILVREGYSVTICLDCSTVLATVESILPHILLIDPALDSESGLDIALILHNQPNTRDMTILFLVLATPEMTEFATAFRRSTIGVLSRPYAKREVEHMVAFVLRRQRSP